MKAVKVSTYEATKFYMEENEKGLSKSKVADMFKIDRHSFCKLIWKDKYKDSDLYYWQTTCREGTKNVLELLYPENCPIYLDRKYDLARAVLKLLN